MQHQAYWCPLSDRGGSRISVWGVRSSAEGAEIEASQAPSGVGCGEELSPSPLGRVICAPSPEIFFLIFGSLIAYFGAFWEPFWVLRCLFQQGKGRLLAYWGHGPLTPKSADGTRKRLVPVERSDRLPGRSSSDPVKHSWTEQQLIVSALSRTSCLPSHLLYLKSSGSSFHLARISLIGLSMKALLQPAL